MFICDSRGQASLEEPLIYLTENEFRIAANHKQNKPDFYRDNNENKNKSK